MPSTREQKAKEKRQRQSDLMSDIENLVVMLGTYSRNELAEERNDSETNLDFESDRQQQSTSHTKNTVRNNLH